MLVGRCSSAVPIPWCGTEQPIISVSSLATIEFMLTCGRNPDDVTKYIILKGVAWDAANAH